MNICVSPHVTDKRGYLRGESFSITKACNNNKQFFVWRELLNVFAALSFIEMGPPKELRRHRANVSGECKLIRALRGENVVTPHCFVLYPSSRSSRRCRYFFCL